MTAAAIRVDTASAAPEAALPEVPFRAIVEQSLAGIYIIQDEVFQYVNATFAAMVGYTAHELIGRPLRDCVPPAFADEVMSRYRKRISGEVKSMRFITQGLHRNGATVYIDVHGSAMAYRGRPAVIGVGINVTEQVLGAEELRRSREAYRRLASYTSSVREEQRSRHARELHDVLGGILTSMKLGVGRLNRGARPDRVAEIGADLALLVNEAIANVRTIAEALRPQTLDHLGLKAAMASHLASLRKRSELRIEFAATDADIDMPAQRAIGVFRIFQEAITNVVRHADAASVTVRLGLPDDATLRLEVADDGCGFEPARRQAEGGPQALGLLGMSERALELGGALRIVSAPGAGTRLTLEAPLRQASAEP